MLLQGSTRQCVSKVGSKEKYSGKLRKNEVKIDQKEDFNVQKFK